MRNRIFVVGRHISASLIQNRGFIVFLKRGIFADVNLLGMGDLVTWLFPKPINRYAITGHLVIMVTFRLNLRASSSGDPRQFQSSQDETAWGY